MFWSREKKILSYPHRESPYMQRKTSWCFAQLCRFCKRGNNILRRMILQSKEHKQKDYVFCALDLSASF